MPATSAPGERPDDEREDDVEDRVQPLERGADPDGEDGAGEVLALAADVEEAAAERERDREPDEDQRRRRDQRLLEVERGATRSSPVTHGKSQLRPEPSKIAW